MLIARMALETGLSQDTIVRLVRRASHMYKVYTIPKRNGVGIRVIEHPSKQLKVLQRWINVRLLSKLPVHESVFSYKRQVGIAQHAAQHTGSRFLLRIDLKDFFPSISQVAVVALLAAHRNILAPALSDADVELVSEIVCRSRRLTIGAPSSPALSNAILYEFDRDLCSYCNTRDITYTRYEDDLFFSTAIPNILTEMLGLVRDRLRHIPGLSLRVNENKSTFTSRKRKRLVTGVVITPESRLSIGRHQKRKIRSLLFQFSRNELSPQETSHLKGLVSFAMGVEPELINALRRKFGEEILTSLKRAPSVPCTSNSALVGLRHH